MANDFDTVEYNIAIRAEQAIKSLKELTLGAKTFGDKVQAASAILKKFSHETGMSLRSTASIFKEMDKVVSQLSGKGGSSVFGPLGKEGWQQVEKQIGASSSGIIGHFNAIRVAAGIMTASLIYGFTSAIQGAIQTAINNLQEFEATLFRISNIERELSLKGVEISVKNLKQGIKELKEFLPIFSEEDLSQMVGSLATATSHLGLTEKQLLDLAKAIAILNVQSVEEESLLQTQSKVVNAIVTAQSRGVGNLGLTFSKSRMEIEATRLGLLEFGETVADLTDPEKTQVKLAIVLDKAGVTGGDFGNLNKFLESTAAKSQELEATWNDFLRDAAVEFAPFILEFLKSSIEFIKGLNKGLQESKPIIDAIVFSLAGIQRVRRDINEMETKESGWEKLLGFISPAFAEMRDLGKSNVFESFKKGFDDAAESAENFGKFVETPTGEIEDLQESLNNFDADGFKNELDDIKEATENSLEDLDTDLTRKRTDIDTEYQRKSADAWLDYQRKLEDINQDSADKITEIKQKFREDDREREAKYQNELWELQQKYLLDLEDALHERDARQIIRLQKQYAIDKESMERKKNLDTNQSQRDMEIDIQQAQNEAKNKREQARLEYERDLQDQQIAKQRELEDLRIWHQRELQDIQTTQQRKLETLIRGWIEEGKITQAGAAQVYSILRGYFGPGGLTDQLYQYMMNSMMSTTSRLPASMSGAPAPYFDLAAASANSLNSGNISGGRTVTSPSRRVGMAEGGTYLARTPQSIDVAEKGPELIQATPIGRLGADINKMFLQSSGKEGLAGAMEIGVTLSPDLEARVINKSLDSVGDIILKVNRTKV